MIGVLAKRHLDLVILHNEVNVLALTGVKCDNAYVVYSPKRTIFYTDFRYKPMVHRVAPKLIVRDVANVDLRKAKRIGYEKSISVGELERYHKLASRNAKFISIDDDIAKKRAVKDEDEIAGIREAAKLNDLIWAKAQAQFKAGMSEKEMANVIRHLMIDFGDGEAFETIVCVGKNAAECHHVPNDTIWNGRESVLVDMGVKLNGYCSDMTRNILPKRMSSTYRKVYELVKEANLKAIDAVQSGISGKGLDKIARDIIKKGGFGRAFGHSLGHGVGFEIHEAPYASKKSKWILKSGMVITIEPGIYLEGNLGVRIEDLVLVTANGCEVLSHSVK